MTSLQRLILLLICLQFSLANTASARSFQAEGSDLLMGVGARNMAMAGAVVADTGDIFASYWNVAGLAEMKGVEVAVSRQMNAELIPVNFFAVGSRISLLESFGLDCAIAFSFIPRLHVKGSGAFREDEFESVFLRYALPGLPGDFDGDIESKTKDYRLSWAIKPKGESSWSFGMAVSYIDCATAFCGVYAEDPGNYIIQSANASALAIHFGGKYYYSDELTFGFNFKDVDTSLDIDVDITDSAGSRRETYRTEFPRELVVGASWKPAPSMHYNIDYQSTFGAFGNYEIDFRILRAGVEYIDHSWSYRGGVIIPLKLDSDKISEIEPPLPFTPTIGIGWRGKSLQIDAVLYAHPVMSYESDSAYPAFDLSLIYHF